jgi:hypothetical protein
VITSKLNDYLTAQEQHEKISAKIRDAVTELSISEVKLATTGEFVDDE